MSEKYGIGSYRRFLQGDETALEDLMREYSDPLVRFALCFVKDISVAEDVVEDAFATLLFKRRHFSDCENFRAYLYRIVRNKCVDHLRFKKRCVSLEGMENVLVGVDAGLAAETRERNAKLAACIDRLPAQYKEALYLAYFEDCKAEAVSRIIRKSKKQTYNLLARAKAALKELLVKEGISYEDV
ncbi:MAG: RNA polymerase sigma factor [Clostridia bacterium]|nr:RNA polymerase sigma factor [Clostridia bacterium]